MLLQRPEERVAPGIALLFLPTDEPGNLFAELSKSSPSSIRPLFPSKTPWISDILLSRLLLLVLGLVIVAPKLACLECPLLEEGELLVYCSTF